MLVARYPWERYYSYIKTNIWMNVAGSMFVIGLLLPPCCVSTICGFTGVREKALYACLFSLIALTLLNWVWWQISVKDHMVNVTSVRAL